MFQLSEKEFEELQKIIGLEHLGRGGRRKTPLVFTECGVAMLSSVLNGPRAISVNIPIMRTFVRLRSFLSMETALGDKIGKLEQATNHLFKIVFERLDNLEEQLPTHPNDRKKVGISD